MPAHFGGLNQYILFSFAGRRACCRMSLPGLTTATDVVARQERFPCLEDIVPGFWTTGSWLSLVLELLLVTSSWSIRSNVLLPQDLLHDYPRLRLGPKKLS